MSGISSITSNGFGYLGNSTIRARADSVKKYQVSSTYFQENASYTTLTKTMRLREALESLKPSRMRPKTDPTQLAIAPTIASVTSMAIDFGPQGATTLTSTEQVNTAPTSYAPFAPTTQGITGSPQWNGPGKWQVEICELF